MSSMMQSSGFTTTKWVVANGVKLSFSSWQENGITVHSVALMIKTQSGWRVKHDSVQYFASPDPDLAAFRASAYVNVLVGSVYAA